MNKKIKILAMALLLVVIPNAALANNVNFESNVEVEEIQQTRANCGYWQDYKVDSPTCNSGRYCNYSTNLRERSQRVYSKRTCVYSNGNTYQETKSRWVKIGCCDFYGN